MASPVQSFRLPAVVADDHDLDDEEQHSPGATSTHPTQC